MEDWLTAIDRLDDLVHNAKAVPLTNEVRLDREELARAVDTLLATLPRELESRPDVVAHTRLAEVVRKAKPVPLAGDVRVPKGELYDLLDALRSEVPAVLAGMRPLTADDRRMLDALTGLEALVSAGRSFFSGRAKVDAASLRGAVDDVHRAATAELRRGDAHAALQELDQLVAGAQPARGERVKVAAGPLLRATERIRGAVYDARAP